MTWRDRAKCAGDDPELYFPETSGSVLAKALCRGCPVQVECGTEAMRLGDYGIRGGTTQTARLRGHMPHRQTR